MFDWADGGVGECCGGNVAGPGGPFFDGDGGGDDGRDFEGVSVEGGSGELVGGLVEGGGKLGSVPDEGGEVEVGGGPTGGGLGDGGGELLD